MKNGMMKNFRMNLLKKKNNGKKMIETYENMGKIEKKLENDDKNEDEMIDRGDLRRPHDKVCDWIGFNGTERR